MSNKHRQPPRDVRAPASITAVSTLGPSGLRHVDFADNPIPLGTDDKITATPHADGTVSVTIGGKPYPAQWWNNIRRAWFTGPADAPVMVDPQPPAPPMSTFTIRIGSEVIASGASGNVITVPPAVKVSA